MLSLNSDPRMRFRLEEADFRDLIGVLIQKAEVTPEDLEKLERALIFEVDPSETPKLFLGQLDEGVGCAIRDWLAEARYWPAPLILSCLRSLE